MEQGRDPPRVHLGRDRHRMARRTTPERVLEIFPAIACMDPDAGELGIVCRVGAQSGSECGLARHTMPLAGRGELRMKKPGEITVF